MPTAADRIETLRRELASAREAIGAFASELAQPRPRFTIDGEDSAEQAEQVRVLRMQVEGLTRALDDARESNRTAELQARRQAEALELANARATEAEARPASPSAPPASVTMELTRQVQEQLLEIESLRAAKARLSEERDRWRSDARRYGGSTQEAKQQEESARGELKRLRTHLADAIKRAETAEKQVKQLGRDLELEQRRQEHLRQHFMRKVSG